MVLSLHVSRYGKRRPCQVQPVASNCIIVLERSRSSEHSTLARPLRAAARRASCTFRAISGPMSISRLAIHHLLQRLAVQETAQILDEQTRDDLVALRVRASNMGQHDDPLGAPERVVGG